MSLTLIADTVNQLVSLSAEELAEFHAEALEIRIYFVPAGETILVTHGEDALLMEGGSGSGVARNAALSQAIAGELTERRLRAIVASHPHRDHMNGHSGLVGAVTFGPNANYFDNGIEAADTNFDMLEGDHEDLPFERFQVMPDGDDAHDHIGDRFGGDDADLHLLRFSTNAQSAGTQVYWSVFAFLRFRDAWMVFTGDVNTQGYQKDMAERMKLIHPRTHFLKISHHGNIGATSKLFADGTRPAISVASTDEDAGHQLDEEVITRLEAVGSEVLATFIPERAAADKARDYIVRTDGFLYETADEEGVIFEVTHQAPALGLGE